MWVLSPTSLVLSNHLQWKLAGRNRCDRKEKRLRAGCTDTPRVQLKSPLTLLLPQESARRSSAPIQVLSHDTKRLPRGSKTQPPQSPSWWPPHSAQTQPHLGIWILHRLPGEFPAQPDGQLFSRGPREKRSTPNLLFPDCGRGR